VNETEAIRIDGVVVTIPREKTAYLVARTPVGGAEVIPFEKVPVEERIAKILAKVGKGAEVIGKKLMEIVSRKKAQELKKVV